MRYARRVNESFVDLTYRGLSLGRRIKLTQVRPSSGYLELPSPMPVGTRVAIATDDGVQFDATVGWIHEQVAGADRPPGMVVLPDLGAEPAAAWWKARVALADDDSPRPRRPTRPVTVRPRSHSRPTNPPVGAIADDRSAIKADLDARIAAAAGIAPAASAASAAPAASAASAASAALAAPAASVALAASAASAAPPASAASAAPAASAASAAPAPTGVDAGPSGPEPPAAAAIAGDRADSDDDEPEMTVSTDEESQPHALPMLRTTGEHAVVDDGQATTIMQSVDPAALGLETGMSGEFTIPGVTIPGPPRGNGGDFSDDDGGPTDPGVGPGRDRR
jgi:hypothetical protein